jgi:hypothetical protein
VIGRALPALLVALVLLAGPPRAAAAEIEVVAPSVAQADAPAVDGRADRIWESAPAVRFALGEGSQGGVEATLRALRTDTHLYLLVEWPDKTESLNRFWELSPSGWKPGRGREDRLNIAWSIGPVREFPAQGCQALCHKTEGVMRTGAPGEKIDLWYWMAQRTNPLGAADNWVMTHEPLLVDGQKTARRPDSPTGAPFEPNWDEAGKRPKLTFKPGAKPGPVLLKKDAVSLPAAARFKPGSRLPREALSPAAGPRAAIEAGGAWGRGRWTVELRRALTTASPDDVQLTGPGPFFFAISIHDDAEKDEHAQMGRDVLRLHFR